MGILAYENITITKYNVKYIENIKIVSKINEHTDVQITAVLDKDEKDNSIYDTSIGTEIQILCNKNDNPVIFVGSVKKISIKQLDGIYYLNINAVSNTIKMDIKKKERSFQDKSQLVQNIVNSITKEYPNAQAAMDAALNNEIIKKFIMQYEETDWEFVKRIASFFNVGLVPQCKISGIRYSFGLPYGSDRGKLDQFNYSITKEITSFLREKENNNKEIQDLDKVYYEVESEEFFDIGDRVLYKDINFYVKESICEIKRSVFINKYVLATKKGCSIETIYNNKIVGLSLKGSVIETKKDELKLHLNIDINQNPENAHFFKHTTMYTADGNSGLYIMPELGDTVYAYFPTKKEWEGVTQNSVRTQNNNGDKINDPEIKYLRTKHGKEIKLSKDEILITCVDDENYIKLNQNTGIEFFSKKPIKISTLEDLKIESEKNIYITAKQKVNMTCKSSSIELDGDVLIKGKEVRHN